MDSGGNISFSRFAAWVSAFPPQTHSAIRLHEIAWMHTKAGYTLQAPPMPRILFAYITEGSGVFKLNGAEHRLKSGDAVIFDMREPYSAQCSGKSWDFVSVQMSSALADVLFGYIEAENGCVKDGSPDLLRICERIYELASSGALSSRRDIEISAALYLLLGIMHTSSAGHDRIKDALNYIANHYMEELQLDKLSEVCHMSLYHFIRCFRQEMHMTPHVYIREYRVQKACELLARTDMSISAVAEKVGYSDASHFSELFKNSSGCLPREYRKLYRK